MIEWLPFIALAGLIIGLFAWLRNDINTARQKHNAQLDALRQETSAQFGSLRQETNDQLDALRQETNTQFGVLHKDIQAIDVRLARVEATIETTFRLQGILPADPQGQAA